MADNTYQPGDLVPLEATFTNAAGTPTNTTATLTVRDPTGATTTPTPTNTSTGVYHYDFPLASNATAGVWTYIFAGSGGVTAVEQKTFVVERITSALSSRALVSLAEAREYVLNDVTDNSQDSKMIRRINSYSEAVWAYTRREWLPTTGATRRFWYRGSGSLSLSPYDLRTVTSMTAYADYPDADQQTILARTSTELGEYDLRPFGGDRDTGTYRWVTFNALFVWVRQPWASTNGFAIQITGDWGLTTVPDDVKLAVLIAVADSTHNPEGGTSRSFGALTINEDADVTAEDRRWRALPGESRALLSRYLDDVGVIVA